MENSSALWSRLCQIDFWNKSRRNNSVGRKGYWFIIVRKQSVLIFLFITCNINKVTTLVEYMGYSHLFITLILIIKLLISHQKNQVINLSEEVMKFLHKLMVITAAYIQSNFIKERTN